MFLAANLLKVRAIAALLKKASNFYTTFKVIFKIRKAQLTLNLTTLLPTNFPTGLFLPGAVASITMGVPLCSENEGGEDMQLFQCCLDQASFVSQ